MRGLSGTVVLLVCLAMIGCAAPPKKESFTLFYPQPPELPRLQWLASFTGARDIQPERSAFDKFVIGAEDRSRRLDKPYGTAIYDGKIYVCDTNRTVMVFDLEEKTFLPLKGAHGAGKLLQPLNISVDSQGYKYITDPVRGQVVIFDQNDRYVRALGLPGVWKPVDAQVFEGKLYVADIKNAVVVIVNKENGEIVKRIGNTGEPVGQLSMPTNLAFDNQGMLYVSDAGKFEVMKYDREGRFVGAIGKVGTNPGSFARPKGIAIDRENRLYVVDAAFDNVQLFNADQMLLLWFGHFGKTGLNPGELYLPAKVVVNYENVRYFQKYSDPHFQLEYLVIVTSQFGDNMVNVYGYGKEKGKVYPTDAELKKELEGKIQKMKKDLDVKDDGVRRDK